jgi:SAM-dependent methyltransferase
MNVETYIKHAPTEVSGISKQWIDALLSLLPKNSGILDIGSGTGRDADYMEDKGFRVTRTDKEPGFVEFQKTKGKQVLPQNVLYDEMGKPESFDAIFANAVLLHFTEDELETIFNIITKCLKKGGFFAFSLKQGDNITLPTPTEGSQYFRYWEMPEIEKLCEKHDLHMRFSQLDEATQWFYMIWEKM